VGGGVDPPASHVRVIRSVAVERLASGPGECVDRADSRPGIPLRTGRPCRPDGTGRAGRPLDVPRDVGLVALAGIGAEDDADEAVPGVPARFDRRRGIARRGGQCRCAQEHRDGRADERDRVSIHGRSSLDGGKTDSGTAAAARCLVSTPDRGSRSPLLQAGLWTLRDARVTGVPTLQAVQRFQGASTSTSMP